MGERGERWVLSADSVTNSKIRVNVVQIEESEGTEMVGKFEWILVGAGGGDL